MTRGGSGGSGADADPERAAGGERPADAQRLAVTVKAAATAGATKAAANTMLAAKTTAPKTMAAKPTPPPLRHLDRWRLTPDGPPILTPAAQLWPVRRAGLPLMLRIADSDDARRATQLLRWWKGDGAARVIAASDDALLMERATGPGNLADLARSGQDDAACRILCDVAAKLHADRPTPPPEALIPLDRWFQDLWPFAATQGGIVAQAAQTARALLADPRDIRPLHGDLHHGNVLDFGPQRGWLAIDPHALRGERGFDFANIFTNPDLSDPTRPLATRPQVFAARVAQVAARAQIDRDRLLRWIVAWCGLSAAWFAQDNDPLIEIDLTVARMAAAALG